MNSSLNIQGQSSQQQQQCSTSIPGHPGREGWQALPTGDFLPPNYTVLNNDVFDHPSPNDAILLCSQMENALANERAKRMEAERLIAQNIADWTRRLSELEGEWQSKLGTAGHGQLPPQESERKSNVVDAGIQVASEAQREDGVLLKECKHRLREAEIWLSKAKLGSSNENLHGCGKGCCSSNGSDSVSLEREEIKAFKVEVIRLMDDLSIQILHHQEKTKHRQSMYGQPFLCTFNPIVSIVAVCILTSLRLNLSRINAGTLENFDHSDYGT